MRTEVKFSSKRFLMTLTLCACSVILLQNGSLPQRSSFLCRLAAMAAGLLGCFLIFLPSIWLRKRGGDVFSQSLPRAARYAAAAVYTACFFYTAEYFLFPYTDMFCKKYYPDTSPCVIALILLICCVYAALRGANVITRFSVFLFALAMLTNLLMFGGSLSSLRFYSSDLGIRGGFSGFSQSFLYFLTPSFTAVLFACLSGYTRNFRLRQPVIALALTGVKYALVLFFIAFAVGEYALRQEYQTFVLSRVAHFGAYAGIESFYMALSTMSVFMIVSLLLCAMCRSVDRNGSRGFTAAFTAAIFGAHMLAVYRPEVREFFTSPLLLVGLSVLTAAIIPSVMLIFTRRGHNV